MKKILAFSLAVLLLCSLFAGCGKQNTELYSRYKALADQQEQVIFGGRLGQYQYFDMDVTVAAALKASEDALK